MKFKWIIIPAALAFVLSFFVSLIFGGVHLLRALLRGGIFAAIFALLAYGINILYQKFLSSVQSSTDANQEDAENAPPTRAPVMGTKIDLTVSDEELPDDVSNPHFNVGSGRVLTSADRNPVAQTKSALSSINVFNTVSGNKNNTTSVQSSSTPTNSSSFTPTPVTSMKDSSVKDNSAQNVENGIKEPTLSTHPSGNTNSQIVNVAQNVNNNEQNEKKAVPTKPISFADELPDIPTSLEDNPLFSDENQNESDEDSDDIISVDDDVLDVLPEEDEMGVSSIKGRASDVVSDSDFAREGAHYSSSQNAFPDGKVADSKDSALMAEAIRTVLAHES